MIGKINTWAQGIIIAIIIGTLITIILPESKNKKYIKVIIGIYTLFCIINPVIGNSLNIDENTLQKYMNLENTTDNQSSSYDEKVQKMFIDNLKKTIKQELNSKKYDSNNIFISTDSEYKILSIKISDIFEYKENSSIVNAVEINIKDRPASGIATSDKEEIIKYLSEKYGVNKENIEIN